MFKKILLLWLALCASATAFQLTPKQQKKKAEQLRKELQTPYRIWRNVEVAYILTDEERGAFDRLQTDEERENFIEAFWQRRDPTPDTVENEFKEEHYRRLAYANEHFASGIPGWKTDRGHIYIVFGPPDEIESHASGGSYQRTPEEGGGWTAAFPFERWRYRHLDNIGDDIVMEFVDPTGSGEYRYTIDPSEKDALKYVPNAGLTQAEESGLSTKAQRLSGDPANPPGAITSERNNMFSRLEQMAKAFAPPPIHARDLEEVIHSRITYNVLPLKVRVDFFPVTEASVLAYVTVQFENRDLQFRNKDGMERAEVNLLGIVRTLTWRSVTSFEETITASNPAGMLEAVAQRKSVYNKTLPLAPGHYRLSIAARDLVGNNLGTFEVALDVPRLQDDRLQTSSVVLADLIERAPIRSIGAGQFALGDFRVRPRVDSVFHRNDPLGVYFNLYHFAGGEVTWEIVRAGKTVFEASDNVTGSTVQRAFDLNEFAPGDYTLHIAVKDRSTGQSVRNTAVFRVE